MDAVPDQQIAELSDCVSVRNLIAGFHAAKIRKGAAVNDFIPCAHIGQIIQILQQVDAEHQFKLVGFISVLPLVIVRSDQLLRLFPRHNPLDPFRKYFLVRADFFQFVVQKTTCSFACSYLYYRNILARFSMLSFCAVVP